MASKKRLLQELADVFSYPQQDYQQRVEQIARQLPNPSSWQPFVEFVLGNRLEKIEEDFTYTFDMRPTTCLEIGWHLYGEDYKRGQFLVKMRQALQEYGIAESLELPDHLSHCLKLLSELPEEDAGLFYADYLRPAIQRIRKGLERENPFRHAVECLDEFLDDLFVETN